MTDDEPRAFHPRPPGWHPAETFVDAKPGRPAGSRRCQAWSVNTGDQCGKAPIIGAATCASHGSAAPQVRAAAAAKVDDAKATRLAERAVTRLGLKREIEPQQALLEELHQTAGLVAWLRTVVDTDGHTDVDVESTAWRAWDTQRAHLVRVAKTCIDAGIAERQVRLAEAQGQLLVDVIRRIFDDPELGLSEEQRQVVGVVAGRHLRAVNA